MQDNQTQQPEIITKTIARAVAMLTASGAKFKVISPNGEEFGELVLAAPEPDKKRKNKYKFGTLHSIYIPHLQNLNPNEVATIPVDTLSGITLEDVRGAACAWATTHWGRGAYTTNLDRTFNNVEVLRFS
jgi:hypothetical protein